MLKNIQAKIIRELTSQLSVEKKINERLAHRISEHLRYVANKISSPTLVDATVKINILDDDAGGEVDVVTKTISISKQISHMHYLVSTLFGEDSQRAVEIKNLIFTSFTRVVDTLALDMIDYDLTLYEIKEDLIVFFDAPVTPTFFVVFIFAFGRDELPSSLRNKLFNKCFWVHLTEKEREQFLAILFEDIKDTITHELIHIYVEDASASNTYIVELLTVSEEESTIIRKCIKEYIERYNIRQTAEEIHDIKDKLLLVKAMMRFNANKAQMLMLELPPKVRLKTLFRMQYNAFAENLTRSITMGSFDSTEQSYGPDYITYFSGFYFYSPAVPGITKIMNTLYTGVDFTPEALGKYITQVSDNILTYSEKLISEMPS